jgi:hypothetical protein
MKTTRLLSLALLLCMMFTLMPPKLVESAGQEIPEAALLATDAFGHILNPDAPFSWNDIAIEGVGQQLTMAEDDNAVMLRSLPFSFPFYEYNYYQIQISIDGVIYIGIEKLPDEINIRPLPFESPPNAIIAPFWEDLALVLDSTHNDGEIWIKSSGEAPNRSYTIQWNNVYRLGSGTPLTFQVVLKESGDIIFNYKTLGDVIPDIPVGIEDSDGIDGIQYQYAVNNLTSEKSVYITRPGPGARLKAFPVYQGGFLDVQSSKFDVTIRNTGTVNDSYTMSKDFIEGNPDWSVQFLDELNDPIENTGMIIPGGERTIRIALHSAFVPIAGDYAKVKAIFQSTTNTDKKFSVQVQAAVPAEFTKVHVIENPTPKTSVLFRTQASGQYKVIPYQSPNSLAILRIGGGKYLLTSDNQDSGGSSNIEFNFIDTSLNNEFYVQLVEDNSQISEEIVRDLAPSMAITPDGHIGIIFIRERIREEQVGEFVVSRMQSNIWFAAVNPKGVLAGPYRITSNSAYGTQQAEGIDFYTSPTITATADNRFTLVWVRNKMVSGERVSDLYKTNLSLAELAVGGSINPAIPLTNGQTYYRYYDPVITSLRGGGSALITSVFKTETMEFNFKIFNLDNDGNYVSEMNLERAMQGVRPDILQLRNGNILFGYTTSDNSGIGYALITPNKTVHRCELPLPAGDSLDYVSITTDPAGNGILTWADRLTSKHYYTLISPNPPGEINACVLLTPPMMYGKWPVSETIRSHYNLHSTTAPLGSPNLFIPLIGQ